MRILATTTSIASLALLTHSCAPVPTGLANNRKAGLAINKRYANDEVEAPELANSLKRLFPSAPMQSAVAEALRSNPNLKLSASRLAEAGFLAKKQSSVLVPSVTADGGLGRTGSLGGKATGSFSVGLDARWEADIWRKLQDGVDARSRSRDALAYELEAAKQSLAAQVMQSWISIVEANKQLALSMRRLASFEKTYKLVNRRFEAGTGNLSELRLAETDIENTKAEIALRENNIGQASRSLSLLMGKFPKAQQSPSQWPALTRSVKTGAPSSLLLRRPDIQAAYERIRAADASVSVAHKDLFPSFPLTSSVGQRSSLLSKLADSNFNTWSLLANVSAPIFDGGNRQAELSAAQERAKQAYFSYQTTVLNAFAEVEDALANERALRTRESKLRNALKASIDAEKQVQRNYENGLVEILTLLDTQRRKFIIEERLINTRAQRLQNRIALARAVGTAI